MLSFTEHLEVISAARRRHSNAENDLYVRKMAVQQEKGKLASKEIKNVLQQEFKKEANTRIQLTKSLDNLYHKKTHSDLIKNWDSKVPILMIPIRLETKFVALDSRNLQLWVRIFPDDIAIQQHEELLTQLEFNEGKNYWEQFFTIEKEDSENEEAKKEAWDNLKSQFGANRSTWVAKLTLPTNWSDRTLLENATELTFKIPNTFKSHEWTKAPYTKMLPDKFVVTIFRRGRAVHEHVGNLIPDTLMLGHDPFDSDSAFKKTEDGIQFDQKFSWLSDFDQAVEIGMGMKIDLDRRFLLNNKDRSLEKIVVSGLSLSSDAQTSANILGQLLDNHSYTTGLSILPQGTATNNTERDSSGYKPNEEQQPKGYFEIPDVPLFQQDPNCDGSRLSKILGIHPFFLENVSLHNCRDHAESVLMNRALYPATLGYYIETLLEGATPIKMHGLIKEFFVNQITSSGPLPAIRIGDQPYGLLPASDFDSWSPVTRDSVSASFNTKIFQILTFFNQQWKIASRKVLYVGRENNEGVTLDPEEVFLDILGLEASSASFERRSGFLRDLPLFRATWALEEQFEAEANAHESFTLNQLNLFGNIDPQISTLIQRMMFTKENKVHIPAKNLIDGLPVSEDRLLSEIPEIGKNYLDWLESIFNLRTIENQDFKGAKAPNFLLYLMARHALLLELRKEALRLLKRKNSKLHFGSFDKTYLNFLEPDSSGSSKNRDVTIWEILNADLIQIGEQPPHPRITTLGDKILFDAKRTNGASAIAEVQEMCGALSKIPTARLERLFKGHLDCLTYRLDAWQTGLFFERLDQRRKNSSNPVTGIYLGAYGYLENLKPENRDVMSKSDIPENLRPADEGEVFSSSDNAGLLHAPSLDHAATAALLMAGYRNHATPSNPGAFSVNLSSARIRSATRILEGVRNGQSLEALLGYQFERKCHEKTSIGINLNQFVLAFRIAFPIQNQFTPQAGNAEDDEVFKRTEPNVVNGLKMAGENNDTRIKTIITNTTPGLSQSSIEDFAQAVMSIIDHLSDALDALKDLLMAESVFQVASGNMARTGAVMEALREGNIPPDPGILQTPRSTRFTFNNLVSIHFPQVSSTTSPWGENIEPSARSIFEPGLNVWLADAMGNPLNIICGVTHKRNDSDEASPLDIITLSDLNIQPIDFMMMAGESTGSGQASIELRIGHFYRSKHSLPDNTKVEIRFSEKSESNEKIPLSEVLTLGKAIQSILFNSRPIHAADYSPLPPGRFSNLENPQQYDVSELSERVNAATRILEEHLENLSNIIPNQTEPKNEENPASLQQLFEQWEEQDYNQSRFINFPVSQEAISQMISLRVKMSLFDLTAAWPNGLITETAKSQVFALESTARIWKAVRILLENIRLELTAQAEEESIEDQVGKLVDVAKMLLGGSFPVMPKFRYHNSGDILSSFSEKDQLLKFYNELSGLPSDIIPESWIQSVAAVRSNIAKWEVARSMIEVQNGQDISVNPIQVPHRKNDSWLAVQFPKIDEVTGKPFTIKKDTISCVIFGDDAFKIDGLQSGWLIDGWAESIPVDTETTGVAFNYNQPDATPPQALLLAISPSHNDSWTWEDLMGVITNTFERVKMRAVEPRHLIDNRVVNNFLPGIVAPINIKGNNISLDFAVASDEFLGKLLPNIELYDPHMKASS